MLDATRAGCHKSWSFLRPIKPALAWTAAVVLCAACGQREMVENGGLLVGGTVTNDAPIHNRRGSDSPLPEISDFVSGEEILLPLFFRTGTISWRLTNGRCRVEVEDGVIRLRSHTEWFLRSGDKPDAVGTYWVLCELPTLEDGIWEVHYDDQAIVIEIPGPIVVQEQCEESLERGDPTCFSGSPNGYIRFES